MPSMNIVRAGAFPRPSTLNPTMVGTALECTGWYSSSRRMRLLHVGERSSSKQSVAACARNHLCSPFRGERGGVGEAVGGFSRGQQAASEHDVYPPQVIEPRHRVFVSLHGHSRGKPPPFHSLSPSSPPSTHVALPHTRYPFSHASDA